ncbi:MAG: leucine-rich repeat domain-containing protein [Pirellulales bacterium]|nr:leucine-rich repeat domain-containing protein [Pirellulales bacterium]
MTKHSGILRAIGLVFALILFLPHAASAITFFEWSVNHGYGLGDALPATVDASFESVHSLAGMSSFDWTTTPTTELNLVGNQITTIAPGTFNWLDYLIHLNLAENQIINIPSGAFSGLEYLMTDLNLDLNQVTSLESGDFTGLDNLTHLSLYGNQIGYIEPDTFSGLNCLTDLTLDANHLGEIPMDMFNGLQNLRRLRLRDNDIPWVAHETFAGLYSLKELCLEGNHIDTIDPNSFGQMYYLENLSLAGNALYFISHDTFSGLCHLTDLDLAANEISYIDPGAFGELNRLTTLSLSDNQLADVEADTFDGLDNLTSLSLSHNQIAYLDWGLFEHLSHLERLSLDGNTSLTELSFEGVDFSSLRYLDVCDTSIVRVSLRGTTLNQTTLNALFTGGSVDDVGLGQLPGITELDLSAVDFAEIYDLSPLADMEDLSDLWLVDVQNLDPNELDLLLDELETMQNPAIEGTVYMTPADYAAINAASGGLLATWNAETGHHVQLVGITIPGDADCNGMVDETDARTLATNWGKTSASWAMGDFDGNGNVGPADAAILAANWGYCYDAQEATTVPEPATLALLAIAAACLLLRRAT